MPEQSLYRRHRPQSFDQVVGQEHVVRTLRNAVERDRVHHAYLFVGSRGTGKTSLAKILARSLNCVEGPTLTPCGVCESCRAIAAGSSLDVIEMDAASNRSVDDIRELRERVGYAPAAGRWKVYILDEAHMLTREAWNAFLKTLEEPPPSTTFVLATTEAHKVMPTIIDRCQRFDFQRPSLEQLAEVVRRVAAQEEIEIEPEAVAAIARSASGSFRDALGTLDQLVAYGGKQVASDDVLAVLGIADGELILEAAAAISASDGRRALESSERLSASGRDVSQFGRDLLAHLRQLLVIRTIGSASDGFSVASADPERLAEQAGAFSDLQLSRAIDAIAAALAAVREGDEPRMTIELAILRSARPQLDPSREALAERLERLEQAFGDGVALPGTPAEAAAGPPPRETPAASAPDPAPPEAPPAAPPTAIAETRAPEKPASGTPVEPGARSEPATAVAAGPPAAVSDTASANGPGGVDLETLRGAWTEILEGVRESGGELLWHALSVARPVSVDVEAKRFEVGFPPDAAFNKRRAESEAAREQLIESVGSVLGTSLRPSYALVEEIEIEAPAATVLSADELVARIKAEFDAEELYHDDTEAERQGDDEKAPEARRKA